MISKLIKTGALAAALLVAPYAAVEAADMKMPVYKGVPRSVVSYYNWTGLYAGFNVGYGTGTSEWDGIALSLKPKGMTYGVTAGYNWQAGSWVVGVEGDYNFATMKNSMPCAAVFSCESENTWFATFRGRVGYAFDRFMPYVTGGGAYGNMKASINTVPPLSTNDAKFGYAFGAGLEYAFLGNWTGKVEYLYLNLGSNDTGFTVPLVNSVNFDASIIRVGLNYKFGGGSGW
jgi:outer membrane immunogenic protein